MSDTKLRTTSDRRAWRKYAAAAAAGKSTLPDVTDKTVINHATTVADQLLAEEKKRRVHSEPS